MRALDLVATWSVGSAAAGVLRSGRRTYATRGDVHRPYPWASVTKLCTALAVLVAVEEGTLSLEDPLGPKGATVAHLLAHASGLAPDRRDALTAPGTRRIYSNAGYEILAEALSERAGIAFAEYVAQGVFRPLGMTGASLAPGSSAAAGAVGTLADLLSLGSELMAPTLVSAETMRVATSVAFAGIPGVLPGYGLQVPCDWGLGFEIRGTKHPHWTGSRCSAATYGHFGRSGSFLWIDPVASVGCAALSDRPWGEWASVAWPVLSDAVLSEVAGTSLEEDRHG